MPAIPRAPSEGSPYPPISDYGLLSDCETTALVASRGSVEWMCLPRMDSPSVFGAILDRDAGAFTLAPADVAVPAGRRYLPGTMVIETTWMTDTGWLVVLDALIVGPWRDDEPGSGWRRAPRDERAEHVLVRTVRCTRGSADLTLECDPVFDYGQGRGEWAYGEEGYGSARVRSPGDGPELTLRTDLRLGIEAGRAKARTTLDEGECAFAALAWSDRPPPADFEHALAAVERTADFWREWLDRGNFPDHPWRIYLQRSALALKGLSYAPTGALAAAGTTSLPEALGGDRNFDYRYTWIRDATFTLWGLYTLGFDTEADDFFHFVAELCGGEARTLQVMYGIGGERDLRERELDHLAGYESSRPVRVGNAAYDQAQHDVWGMVLDSIWLHARSHRHVADWVWPIVDEQVRQALEHWREPDHGIWEVRGEPRHFTSSKLLCWVAADRGSRLATLRGENECARRWAAAADEIRGDILERGVDRRGVFVQHYGTAALDASLLLVPLVRFLPPDDDRVRRTVLAIADELSEGELVLRYRVEETDDGFTGPEGTFVICSFWLVSALTEIGEVERAQRLCEKLLTFASPLRLYAEELDPHSGRHLGNFPQAFSHLALINAVMHVIRAGQERDAGRFAPVGAEP